MMLGYTLVLCGLTFGMGCLPWLGGALWGAMKGLLGFEAAPALIEPFRRRMKKIDMTPGQRETPKVKPCICGKSSRKSLFKSPGMSPSGFDVGFGTFILVVLESILLIAPVAASSPSALGLLEAELIFGLPIPLVYLVLAVVRLTQGHRFACSLRWAWVAFAGQSRFVNFF